MRVRSRKGKRSARSRAAGGTIPIDVTKDPTEGRGESEFSGAFNIGSRVVAPDDLETLGMWRFVVQAYRQCLNQPGVSCQYVVTKDENGDLWSQYIDQSPNYKLLYEGKYPIRPLVPEPWIQLHGAWELPTKNTQASKKGTYKFVPLQVPYTTTGLQEGVLTVVEPTSQGPRMSRSIVVTVRANVTRADFNAQFYAYDDDTLKSLGIQVIESNIQHEMQALAAAGRHKDRNRLYVLPSQLNAAEYPSQHDIVKQVAGYLNDNTGGPRGQLGGDPGVAQFIIDNAANAANAYSKGHGIDNTRKMGKMDGISLQNGYLQVEERESSAVSFGEKLQEMELMGVRDVEVVGLDPTLDKFVEASHPTNRDAHPPNVVDLAYASAVPMTASYGNLGGEHTTQVGNMTLYAQYTAALRMAAVRGNCDAILMPLGGGVFNNKWANIKRAIAAAFKTTSEQLKEKDVRVYVLAYNGQQAEAENLSALIGCSDPPYYTKELQTLVQMGFDDQKTLFPLLQQNDGDVEKVVGQVKGENPHVQDFPIRDIVSRLTDAANELYELLTSHKERKIKVNKDFTETKSEVPDEEWKARLQTLEYEHKQIVELSTKIGNSIGRITPMLPPCPTEHRTPKRIFCEQYLGHSKIWDELYNKLHPPSGADGSGAGNK